MKRRNLFRLVVAATVIFVLSAVVIVLAGLRDDIGHADAALVLGSKVNVDGEPSPRLRARLDKTVVLYRAGWFPDIIASGGIGKEGHDEAVVMKAYLVGHGIPGERVIMDNSGATTFGSARRTRQILRDEKFSSVLVISQWVRSTHHLGVGQKLVA